MKQAWQMTTTRTIDLGWEQMLVLEGRPGTRVKVLFGNIWLTEAGGSADHFPQAGEEVALSRTGNAVIEPLGPAWIQITERKEPGGWRGLVERARAFFARDPSAQPESV